MNNKMLASEIKPFISVVMCSYNETSFLKEAIESVLNQSFQDFELVISDDASPNKETHKILGEYRDNPRIRIFSNKENRGYLKNKNFAISQAKGEYITQLDNDDLYHKDKLQKQVDAIRENDAISIVSCGYNRIDELGKPIDSFGKGANTLIKSIPNDYPFWFPSLLFKNTILKEVGYFNEYFSGTLGDDFYWTVLANKKYSIYHVGEILYSYRYNPNSITNVLNNERKIIVPIVLKELIRQQKEIGSDWLQTKNLIAIDQYEKKLLRDRRLMAEQYRIWAAKAIDKKDFPFASKLLKKAISIFPFSLSILRTIVYFIKSNRNA